MRRQNVVLTAILDSHLTYVSDTCGVAPRVSGNNVTWDLPDLALLEECNFTLTVQVPASATSGTRYPRALLLTSAGPEANGSDNAANAEIMAAYQLFLPLVLTGH